MENPLALREAFKYIPAFQGSTFVIKINGDLVESNLPKIAEDIALLWALGIKIVVVFGCQKQIQDALNTRSAKKRRDKMDDGYWITNPEMLEIVKAICAGTQLEVTNELARATAGIGGEIFTGNVIVAKRLGVLEGTDYQLTGEVDAVKAETLRRIFEAKMIPVISPLASTSRGEILHLMADEVAAQVAIALKARKLIFMTSVDGIYTRSELLGHATVEEMDAMITSDQYISGEILFKAKMAVLAGRHGVPRTHIINGRKDGALLLENFSRDGAGTLIYNDSYAEVRPAEPKDLPKVLAMAQPYVEAGAIVKRTLQELTERISELLVYEKDGEVIGCCRIVSYSEDEAIEIGYLVVSQECKRQGIASKLLEMAENIGRIKKYKTIFALTTRAESWFVNRSFREVAISSLPVSRQQTYDPSRGSKIMSKKLEKPDLK